MSNDADFLARWSRRKHDAATDKIKQAKQIETSTSATSETDPASLESERKYTAIRPREFTYNRIRWCRIQYPRFPRNRGA